MKSFFGRFLAAFLALCVFSFFAFIFLLFLFSGLIGSFSFKTFGDARTQPVAASSFLVIPVSVTLTERAYEGDIKESVYAAVFDQEETPQMSLSKFQELLKAAKEDKKITGVLLKVRGAVSNNFATLVAMRAALADFKQSGKKIYAYGNSYTDKSYFLASVADSVFAEPESYFLWQGLSVQYAFYKKAIDKLGVQPQIFYAGKYKSATEPYRSEKMSAENKEQVGAILRFYYDKMIKDISVARGISPAQLQQYADDLSAVQPMQARSLRLIDAVLYEDEVSAVLKKTAGLSEEQKLSLHTLADYSDHWQKTGAPAKKKAHKIAVVYLDGAIEAGSSARQGRVGGDRFVKLMRSVVEDKTIAGIVLRINSPGGDVQASDKIYHSVQLAKQKKPLVVSFGSVAASGGYYIASAADYIIADSFGITGSIGVFAVLPNFEQTYKQYLGMTFDKVATAKNTLSGTTEPLNRKQRQLLQSEIDRIYADFKEKVARARKLSPDDVEKKAQGRVWTNQKALQIGLVDSLGSCEDALAHLAHRLNLGADYTAVAFPKKESRLDWLLEKPDEALSAFLKQTFFKKEELQVLEQYERFKAEVMRPNIRMTSPFALPF